MIFSDLPSEIHSEIAKYLTVPDFISLSQICIALQPLYQVFSWRLCIVSWINKGASSTKTHRFIPYKAFLSPKKFSWFKFWEVQTIIFTDVDNECTRYFLQIPADAEFRKAYRFLQEVYIDSKEDSRAIEFILSSEFYSTFISHFISSTPSNFSFKLSLVVSQSYNEIVTGPHASLSLSGLSFITNLTMIGSKLSAANIPKVFPFLIYRHWPSKMYESLSWPTFLSN